MLVLSKSANRLVNPNAITIDKYTDKDSGKIVYTLNAFDAAGMPHLLGRYASFEECQDVLKGVYEQAADQGEPVIRLD